MAIPRARSARITWFDVCRCSSVDPVADRDVAADEGLAGSAQMTPGSEGAIASAPIEATVLIVERRAASHAAVGGLEDAAGRGAHVETWRLPGTPTTAEMRLPLGPMDPVPELRERAGGILLGALQVPPMATMPQEAMEATSFLSMDTRIVVSRTRSDDDV